jgi:hypothetical protein
MSNEKAFEIAPGRAVANPGTKEHEIIKPAYNFDFILLSLGLISIGDAAINPASVLALEPDDKGGATIFLHGGLEYELSREALTAFEQAIKQRGEDSKILQREAFKANASMQNEVIQELQRGVVGAQLVGANKRRH